jgi:hypothetical protein
MATRAKKKPVASKAVKIAAVSVAQVVRDVELHGRARRVPGRKVAVVPLADLRRLRQLERELENREDRAAVAAVAARPDAYSDLADVRARLLG